MKKDDIYKTPLIRVPPFQFDAQVASVFDDMAPRSIPHYEIFQNAITDVASTFYQPNTQLYDLGCSTGNTILQLIQKKDSSDNHITGVDSSHPMLVKCQEKLSHFKFKTKVTLKKENVLESQIPNASVVILNFVLQFIPPEQKLDLLTHITSQLPPRGALIISEKLKLPSALTQSLFEDIHHQYKAKMGYSRLEIAQKRDALENVLHLKTTEELTGLLRRAGLLHITPIFQWFNFAAFLAIKV